MGPDPHELFEEMVSEMKTKMKSEGREITRWDEDGFRSRFAQLTGEAFIVGRPFIAEWAKRHGYHGFADTNLDYILTAPSITPAIRNAYEKLDPFQQLQLDSIGVYIP